MKGLKIVNYQGLGEIIYKKNFKARNISVRINREAKVRVTVPGWCSFSRAEKFVFEKHDWIIKKKNQINNRNEIEFSWKPGDRIPLIGGNIRLVQGVDDHFSITREEKEYILGVPEGSDTAVEEYRAEIREIVARIGLQEAKRHLPGILAGYSEKFALSFGRLGIKRMRSRWGSCSSKNNISLSSGLVFLEPDLIEYVCLHELTHTIHKNHSPGFWDALGGMLPDYAQRRKRLRDAAIIA